MQKIYSLLRSNKQSGPYTLDELLQLNLKAFDLIWVEGKSGGWSYPTEIEALKMYVLEPPKSLEEKEISTTSQPANQPTLSQAITSVIEEKPISSKANAKHIYISLPAGKQVTPINTDIKEPIETFEESPEAKLERKAMELRNKIQAFTENKNTPKVDNDLDTKYSRSLDDIKQEYSSWLYQQQKKKKVFPTKYMVPAVAVSILLAAAYFLFPLFFHTTPNDTTVLASQNNSTSLPQSDNYLPEKKPITKKRIIQSIKPAKKIKENISVAKPTRVNTNEEIDKVDTYLDSLKTASQKKNRVDDEIVYQPASSQNDGTRQSTKRTAGPQQTNSQTENDPTPFTELIKLSESTGNGSPHLSLYNNSDKYIKFIAVDVHYYKANRKLLQKKTLYFKDISPKSSARLYLPQEKNAASVNYEIGLISTDSGLYYAKQ
jgi:hypothetical protein